MGHYEALKLLYWYENQDHRLLSKVEEKGGKWYLFDLFTDELIMNN